MSDKERVFTKETEDETGWWVLLDDVGLIKRPKGSSILTDLWMVKEEEVGKGCPDRG